MAVLQFGTYIILVCALVANAEGQRLPSEDYFSVVVEPWGECRRINESRSCYRTRNAFCVRTTDEAIAPWYYCTDNGLQREPTVELCPPESCVQDCVVSVWSEWSECNCSASKYRSRCREIVVPPKNNGAECPQLLQNDTCNCRNTIDYLPRNYTWKLGKWGDCGLAVSTSSQQPHQCGHGLRNRSVQCVDLGDAVVNDSYCVMEEAYSHVLPPTTTEFCEIPCPCVLGDWSDWGECTPVCDTPTPSAVQRRERTVLQFPTLPDTCEDPIEIRECNFNSDSCPRYTWNTSDWSSCALDSSGSCGIGLSRRYIYCLETLDGKTRSVGLEECDKHLSDPRPPNLDVCEIPCPQNCVVSRWSAWSPCPVSCNLTYSNRTRNVVIEAQGDGSECPHLLEYMECPLLPCVQWRTGDFSSCFPASGSCGNGTKTRAVYCEDPSEMVIEYEKCTHLPQPGRSTFCYKPCANDCVISEWTTWSQCSQDCRRGYGIQTRTRRLLAYGTTPCLYETANLTEIRNCTSDIPCSDAVYHIQLGEWNDCAIDASGDAPPTLLTRDGTCGVGVQTRAAVCLKNDQVIAGDACPFTFQPIQTRRCNVSCSKECVISEWEEFSACSASCGESYQSRSRRLLEFSSPPDVNCPASLNSQGIETETISCNLPACPADNSWWTQPWSECYTHPTVLSKLSPDSVILREVGSRQMQCGIGYQNRSVSCGSESMEVLSDHFCSHLSDQKPDTSQLCLVPCPDKCIITSWTEFGLCVDGALSRSREIIPFVGSSDWRSDCPELADVETEDSIPCSGDDTPYGWTPTSLWGECILDSPDAMCGQGFEYRSIACVDVTESDPEKPVSEELCPLGTMPLSKRSCTVLCERDCILSDWSDYSECSVTFRHGYKSRMREILQSPREGGRECGPLVEFSVCYIPPYEISHRYVVTTLGCLPENTSAVCGEGYEQRELVCLVNGVEQPDTTACSHNPPFRNHTCTLACPGECVVSDWGPFSVCPDVCPTGQTCYRNRFRRILRDGTNCPTLVQNRRCDEFANPYVWMAQSWRECTVTAAGSVSYCGNGFQERIIECMNILTNETAFEERCSGERPADVRACSIPCPVDCQVSPFSAWSECPSVCEFSPVQSRERSIVIHPSNGGRDCPRLYEERSCILRNCDVYRLQGYESRCYPVYTLNSTCGSVPSAAPISCLKNNRFVDVKECLDADARELQVIGATTVDLQSHSEGYCDLECPLEPECAFEDEWSEWSECQTLCHEPGAEGSSFRTRKLLKAHERSRERCLSLQYEQTTCNQDVFSENETSTTTMPPVCIEFNWQSSVWNPDQSRTVWCHSSTAIEVANGCVESLRPVEQNGTCRSTCDGFFYCNVSSGICQCSPLYELVSAHCLPPIGCALDSHCLYPDMVCDTGTRKCTCRTGTRLENGICVAIPTTVPTTPLTTVTTATMPTGSTPSTQPTTSDAPPTNETAPTTTVTDPTDLSDTPTPSSSSKGLGILPIVLAVVPVLVIIIIVLMLIAILYRCRKQSEEKQKRDGKVRITISEPMPLTSEPMPLTHLNNEPAEEDHTDHSGMLRRGADSASSGFVDDIEHDLYKYGMAGRNYNDPAAQTMQALDVDEAAIRHNAQQYLPQHAQQFMPDGAQQYIPEHQHQYLSDHAQDYDHVPYGAFPSTRSHTPSPLPMAEMQSYHHHHHPHGEMMHVDGRAGRGGARIEHQVMGGMISGSEESRMSQSSSSHYGRTGEFAYRGADNYDYLPPVGHMTHHPAHMHPNSYRDERIATGLDGPLVRAIEQLTSPGRTGDRSRSPSMSSRSSGRASGRGSRRRRHPRVQGPGERVQHPTYPGPYPYNPPIASPMTPLSPYGPGSSPYITSSPYSPRRTFVYPSSSSPYHSTTASVHPASPQLSARNPAPYSPTTPHTGTTTPIQPSSPRMSARNVQRTPQNLYISNPYSGTTAPIQPASPRFDTRHPAPHSPSTPHTGTTTPIQLSSPRMSARNVQHAPQNLYISHPRSGVTAPVQPPSPHLNAQNPVPHSPSNPHTHTAALSPPPPPPPPPPVRNESLGAHTPAPSQHLTPPGTALSAPNQSPQYPRQPSPLVRHTYRDSSEGYELELPQTFTVNPPRAATAVTNFSRGVTNPMWNEHHNQA